MSKSSYLDACYCEESAVVEHRWPWRSAYIIGELLDDKVAPEEVADSTLKLFKENNRGQVRETYSCSAISVKAYLGCVKIIPMSHLTQEAIEIIEDVLEGRGDASKDGSRRKLQWPQCLLPSANGRHSDAAVYCACPERLKTSKSIYARLSTTNTQTTELLEASTHTALLFPSFPNMYTGFVLNSDGMIMLIEPSGANTFFAVETLSPAASATAWSLAGLSVISSQHMQRTHTSYTMFVGGGALVAVLITILREGRKKGLVGAVYNYAPFGIFIGILGLGVWVLVSRLAEAGQSYWRNRPSKPGVNHFLLDEEEEEGAEKLEC